MPELPPPDVRWTVPRKAAVVEAVSEGGISIEEVCRLYRLSIEELLAWKRDLDRHGRPGLRATRYQMYRDQKTGKNGQ
jgi:transposase-like protein